jgi:hypothetical protein
LLLIKNIILNSSILQELKREEEAGRAQKEKAQKHKETILGINKTDLVL